MRPSWSRSKKQNPLSRRRNNRLNLKRYIKKNNWGLILSRSICGTIRRINIPPRIPGRRISWRKSSLQICFPSNRFAKPYDCVRRAGIRVENTINIFLKIRFSGSVTNREQRIDPCEEQFEHTSVISGLYTLTLTHFFNYSFWMTFEL